MNKFLLDLWYDLREKRLWPVAVGLVLALLATPVLLRKSPSEEPQPAAAPASAPTASAPSGAEPVVKLAEAERTKLDAFDAKDPFRPVGRVASGSSSGSGESGSSGPSGGSSSSGGDSGGSSGGSTESGSTEGDSTGGSTPAPAPTGDGGGEEGDGDTRAAYTYTVDVRFGARGEVRNHADVARLDMLPSEERPLLVFLGVSVTGKTAVFMVDDSLSAEGEGSCRPSPRSCSFLYLRMDDEHDDEFFADEAGTRYHLHLVRIELVRTDELERQGEQAEGSRRPEKRRQEPRPFLVAPLFADER